MEDKIQSIVRVFDILESFEKFPKGAGLTELSKEVNLHKSTVHRFLNTLISLGYVKQDEDSKYSLTYKLYSLANTKLAGMDFIGISHEFIKNLSKDINEVVHLVTRDGIYVVYVDKIDAQNAVTLNSRIGRRSPLVKTSVGKAILSFLENSEIKEIVKKTIEEGLIKKSDIKLEAFLEEIEEVRKSKIAIDDEENEKGIYCLGTAIINGQNEIEGAISITGPKFRIIDKDVEALKKKLLLCSQKISKNLGYLK